MKRVFLLGGLFLIFLAACSKKDSAPAFDEYAQFLLDSAKISTYLTANNITATHEANSIFYRIIDSGDVNLKPTRTSNITIAYLGTRLDGSGFDSSKSANFDLNRLVTGWQIGIPLIGKGGHIQLYLPSYFAYQQYGQGAIAPNTPLVFDIKLIDFINK
ncbi:FKBP-type peptidyl-prolyl cis-trans isomerase [Chitinophaga sp. MM2321]|uniref:FKBP-type peptidyl-prolyl cis-trans isomerase n=1 Tax=Chitinophaga sp. MM2321 TaxID=3137178 RepID=UPI0032D591DB